MKAMGSLALAEGVAASTLGTHSEVGQDDVCTTLCLRSAKWYTMRGNGSCHTQAVEALRLLGTIPYRRRSMSHTRLDTCR